MEEDVRRAWQQLTAAQAEARTRAADKAQAVERLAALSERQAELVRRVQEQEAASMGNQSRRDGVRKSRSFCCLCSQGPGLPLFAINDLVTQRMLCVQSLLMLG